MNKKELKLWIKEHKRDIIEIFEGILIGFICFGIGYINGTM